jgi:hypothetical protein
LNGEILSAQQSAFAAQADQFALRDRIRDLEKEVADSKAWDAEKQNYELKPVGHVGALGYVVKKTVGSAEPEHFLCKNCYQEGCKSILQKEVQTPVISDVLVCPRCLMDIYLTGERRAEHMSPKPSSRRGRG